MEFANLGLVVTDEQHRFGVNQRAKLSQKGGSPHMLVMSATPIPRTLALILYGDLDISVVNEMPPGRTPVKTYVIEEELRDRAYSFVGKHIVAGRQAYVVCPLVEESEKIDTKAATELAGQLAMLFPQYQVDLLHGKMRPKQKNEIMQRFAAGETQILVSTTVIEVGVNVPNATVMVVETRSGSDCRSCIRFADVSAGAASSRFVSCLIREKIRKHASGWGLWQRQQMVLKLRVRIWNCVDRAIFWERANTVCQR